MKQQTGIEIYVKDCSNEQRVAWIESAFGTLGTPEDMGGMTLYASSPGPIIISDNIEDRTFASVWFKTPQSPWKIDVDCGRQAARELGCIVRCDPGQQLPEGSPTSDMFLEIKGNDERLVSRNEPDKPHG